MRWLLHFVNVGKHGRLLSLSFASLRRNVDLWQDRFAPILSGKVTDAYGLDLPFESPPRSEIDSISEIIDSLQEVIRSRDVRAMPRLLTTSFGLPTHLVWQSDIANGKRCIKLPPYLYGMNFRSSTHIQSRSTFRGRCFVAASRWCGLSEDRPASFQVNPREFEEMIAFIFQSNGFEIELTPLARDGGRDVFAIQRSLGVLTRWLVECKRYAAAHKVGVELVRQLYGVLMNEQANKALLVTTSSFTAGAREFANRHPWSLTLRDGPAVLGWANAAV